MTLTPEGDETIALYLSNVDGAVIGSRDTVVYTIHDNDYTRDLQFFTPDSTIDEGIDSMAVIVELSQPDGSNPITVDMIFSGTATGDSVDYDTLSTTFVIPAGDSLDTLYIPIIDDVFDEGCGNHKNKSHQSHQCQFGFTGFAGLNHSG